MLNSEQDIWEGTCRIGNIGADISASQNDVSTRRWKHPQQAHFSSIVQYVQAILAVPISIKAITPARMNSLKWLKENWKPVLQDVNFILIDSVLGRVASCIAVPGDIES
ncbi:hypothetical protein TNCV_2483591 [Trichonephila clavipes]|uniref:Uncharacterized protein n=1 Tax=Trichonephila clavipes TaxID=2585209 RepID=A0A8X6VZ47_TRICX|nr:hypothetical protein TNCV_2483591 [Trichonephila clavipes]